MSAYKSLAIIGFGDVGAALLAEFVKTDGYSLRVLTRAGSDVKPSLAAFTKQHPNVAIHRVDYDDPDAIAAALSGVDVAFSALRDDGLGRVQEEAIRAAKRAGVRLFVPSEYGIPTIGAKFDYLKDKVAAHALLKELQLPYTLFFTGVFPEVLIAHGQFLGYDFKQGQFNLLGTGDIPMSWTSVPSIASFVHHVFTTLPPSQLENHIFRIEGDRRTWHQVIAIWERVHKRKANVHYMTPAEIQAYKRDAFTEFLAVVQGQPGHALTYGEDNKLFPGWKPLKWEDLLGATA